MVRLMVMSIYVTRRQNPYSRHPPVYQDLNTRHDWLVKRAIVDLQMRLKGDSKRNSGNSLSRLGAQNKDIGAAYFPFVNGLCHY